MDRFYVQGGTDRTTSLGSFIVDKHVPEGGGAAHVIAKVCRSANNCHYSMKGFPSIAEERAKQLVPLSPR